MSATERRESFVHQPVGTRAAIVVAGPLANFLLAIVIFAGLAMIYGKPSTSPRVDTIQPDSAAAAAGFQPGDVVCHDQWARDRELLRDAADRQHQRGRNADLRGRSRRRPRHAQGRAGAQGSQGSVRQRPPHGVLGISRSPATGRASTTSRSGRCRRSASACKETWFVIERTMSYHRRGLLRPRDGRPARRADPDRPGVGAGGEPSVCRRCCISLRCCRSRSGCSICFRCRCSMAVTFCSTRSKLCAAGRCRSGRRRSAFGSVSRSS